MTKFYDSNFGDFIAPTESGWYIEWKTESCDSGFVKVDTEIKNDAQALEMLKQLMPWEMVDGDFYAYVQSFCYVDLEKEAAEKIEKEAGQDFVVVQDDDGNNYSIPADIINSFNEANEGDPYEVYCEFNEYCTD